MPTLTISCGHSHGPGLDYIAELGSTMYYLATTDHSCSLREALTESGFSFRGLKGKPTIMTEDYVGDLRHYEEQVFIALHGAYYCANYEAEHSIWCSLSHSSIYH